MADIRAIASVTHAVVDQLRSSYDPADFNNTPAEFRIYTPADFANPMQSGVSLFLYRVFFHGSSRTPAGRLVAEGRRKSTLPLELHFLLTVWSNDATFQHILVAWMMRVLEDSPLLPSGVLNARFPAFGSDESIEVTVAELPTEDMLRLWEALDTSVFQLSVPYLARVLAVESEQLDRISAQTVESRGQQLGRLLQSDEANSGQGS